jgi:DNA repair protein RecO (recombination protein O)
MTGPRNYQTEAIIIKKTKLGEADRILTLYTPHLGRIQAVAKGVRRPRSKLSGHLELLTHSQVSLARGKNLDTVTGSQTIDSFIVIKSDLELASYALYITELLHKFTEEHIENYPLFRLLLETLKQLEKGNHSELMLRYFELHLLGYVGYRPQLQHCVVCHSSLATGTNSFSATAGGMLCHRCSSPQPFSYNLSPNGLRALRLLQDDKIDVDYQLEAEQQTINELQWIMRNYIGYLLEREIKSAAWLDTLKQQSRKGQIALL